MATPLTDSTAVLAVLDPDTQLTALEVDPFIEDAAVFRETHLTGRGISTDALTVIEKYLAAHFATGRSPVASERAMGDRKEKFIRSKYWDVAERLDPTGTLAGLSNPRSSILFRVGGQ